MLNSWKEGAELSSEDGRKPLNETFSEDGELFTKQLQCHIDFSMVFNVLNIQIQNNI